MNETQQKLKEYFHEQDKVVLSFLFGSQAKECPIKESDFDIAVWLADFNKDDVNRIWSDLENILKKEVDLVVLNKANPSIAWAVLRGKALLIRDYRFYLEYMLEVSKEAEDFQDFIIDLWRLREKYRKKAG